MDAITNTGSMQNVLNAPGKPTTLAVVSAVKADIVRLAERNVSEDPAGWPGAKTTLAADELKRQVAKNLLADIFDAEEMEMFDAMLDAHKDAVKAECRTGDVHHKDIDSELDSACSAYHAHMISRVAAANGAEL